MNRQTWRVAALGLLCWIAALPAWADPPRATDRLPTCSWDNPGHNPFMGDVVGAVDRYTDIAPDVRNRLKRRMAARQYDDMVSIRRDTISGKQDYGSSIREMHFGTKQVCGTVTRTHWTPAMEERGLVYCESGQCILVPTVCRNVSRIDGPTAVASEGGGPAGAPGEMPFDPPAAGLPGLPDTDGSFASGGMAGPLGGGALGGAGGAGPTGIGGGLAGPTYTPTEPRVAPFYPSILPPDGVNPAGLGNGGGGGGGGGTLPVPEPASGWLLLAGGAAVMAIARRRRR